MLRTVPSLELTRATVVCDAPQSKPMMRGAKRHALIVIGTQSHACLKLAASWVMELSGRIPKAQATADNAAETDDFSDVVMG